MTVITVDMGPKIEMRDVENLRQRLAELGPEDEIKIRMEATDADDSDPIVRELDRQGFDWQPHGSHAGRNYYLIARKKF